MVLGDSCERVVEPQWGLGPQVENVFFFLEGEAGSSGSVGVFSPPPPVGLSCHVM